MANLSPGRWSPQRAATEGCFPPPSPSPLQPSSPSCTPPEMTGWGSRGYHEESKSRTLTSQLPWRLWVCRGPRELQRRRSGVRWRTTTDINSNTTFCNYNSEGKNTSRSTYWELILEWQRGKRNWKTSMLVIRRMGRSLQLSQKKWLLLLVLLIREEFVTGTE